ncbi:MAG: PQQ-dependent sugar dehydrogenase [Spirochaetia bacterium]
MKKKIFLYAVLTALTISSATGLPDPVTSPGPRKLDAESTTFEKLGLSVSNLVTGLDTPWDLVWGPDDYIWVTERPGLISRIDPETGNLTRIADITVYERGESGLMGLVFDPGFEENRYIFTAESHTVQGSIINQLVRYRYTGTGIEDRHVIIDNIPGNTYHDGARLAIGPDKYIYMTTGDAGKSTSAQDVDSLAGKILRIDRDGNPAPGNPFGNHVYSYGHRNAQGMVFHPDTDKLFITEHGPQDNDEAAIVEAGQNHGWPQVHGFCDNDVSGEREFCRDNKITEPLAAWTPTIAPAGADFYTGDLIPEWRGDFLFVTLKGSALLRLQLKAENQIEAVQVISEDVYGRLRDVLVGPDGTIYIATSNRDGRGNPASEDDRILAVRPE